MHLSALVVSCGFQRELWNQFLNIGKAGSNCEVISLWEMHTGHRQKMRTQWTEKIKLPDKTMKIRKTISTLTVTKPVSPTFGEYLYFVKK